MHKMGWTDIWYIDKHFSVSRKCFVGIWTGEQRDLICVKKCDTNKEAEKALSPEASNIFIAAVRAYIKARELFKESLNGNPNKESRSLIKNQNLES